MPHKPGEAGGRSPRQEPGEVPGAAEEDMVPTGSYKCCLQVCGCTGVGIGGGHNSPEVQEPLTSIFQFKTPEVN